MEQTPAKSKIFVDGNCIVCDWEISHYKRIAPDRFELVDISHPQFDASRYNLTADAVDRNLHVLTPEGELRVGVDAFVHIWGQIPRYRFARSVIRVPGVYQLAKVGYWLFTILRPYLPKRRKR